jgi:hypothetical protein
MFDETQVTKVDALQGSIRELRSEIESGKNNKPAEGNLEELINKAKLKSGELKTHLEIKSAETKNSREHYRQIIRDIAGIHKRVVNINTGMPLESLDKELVAIEKDISPLTKQTPYTLLMMRIVEIGLPVLLSLLSVFFVFRYSLTEKRSHEIKDLLKQRNSERSDEAKTDKE